ncbi:MAG TPA: DUF58 domain-containing protein [Solirubrobacterales bacterium]|nr:DUF58 domain-containing protein [Solirubrobacterales bacterium]
MDAAREAPAPRAPATAALGVTFILVGLGFGLTAALVCGIALLGLAIVAVGWVELATLRGRLERLPGPARLEESEPYPLGIRLQRTILPPPGGELTDPLLERSVPVGPRWSKRLERAVWLQSPGRVQLDPTRLVVRDPLGLWQRRLASPASLDLVVLPRIDPVRWVGPGAEPRGQSPGSGHASDAISRRGGPAQFEVDGLRPYRDGSPASRIHWPAVARTGEMIERRLVAGGEPRPLVVFDPRGAEEPAHWERAMRATASLCVELGHSGGCDLLLPGERRPFTIDPALRSWPEAHVRIAVSDPDAGPPLLPALRGSAVLWVTAGRALPAAVRQLRAGSFLITPTGSRRVAAFRVSGCFGYPADGGAKHREARRRVAA